MWRGRLEPVGEALSDEEGGVRSERSSRRWISDVWISRGWSERYSKVTSQRSSQPSRSNESSSLSSDGTTDRPTSVAERRAASSETASSLCRSSARARRAQTEGWPGKSLVDERAAARTLEGGEEATERRWSRWRHWTAAVVLGRERSWAEWCDR